MKPIPAVIAPARSAKTRSVKAFTLSLSRGARADCDEQEAGLQGADAHDAELELDGDAG